MNNRINVWAIKKDILLKVLLIEWQHRHGVDSFALNLHEQNFKAIEFVAINNPQLRAYVYTFAQTAERYGIDLLYPTTHNIIGENENQTLEQTLSILQTHLLC